MEKEAIQLLNEYKKYEDSLRIAEQFGFISEAKEIKEKYLKTLLETKAYDKAGLIYEKDGNFEAAVKLYIEGNFFINAVNLIIREHKNKNFKTFSKENIDRKLVDFLANSLVASGLYEKSGQFIAEISDDINLAIDLFIRGNCFEKAINLAKKHLMLINKSAKDGRFVNHIEESWGDYLFNQGHYEQAIPHYLESLKIEKAIGCYINTKKWPKAIELMEKLEDQKLCKEFNLKIAENFRKEKNLMQAELYFKKANEPEKILELYIDLQAWDKLEGLLSQYDFKNQLLSYGVKLESKGKLKEAERVYLYAAEPDLAIKMYKNAKHYDEMILLVKKHLPHLLDKTYDMLGNLCEKEFNFKKAEEYYTKTINPNKAVEMYFANNLIEDALKLLSKLYFGNFDVIEKIIVDYKNNFEYNFDELIKVILKLNYYELAIRLECLQGNYEKAIDLAESHAKEHLPVVYFSIAEDLKKKKITSKLRNFT